MKAKKRSRLESVILILATLVSVSAAVLLFLFYTTTGRKFTSKVVASYLHGAINYVSTESSGTPETKKDTESGEALPENREEPEEKEKTAYHILLLGEEAIKSTPGKGRTDAILLVTVQVEKKVISVTSVLRDIYVEPEGVRPCKINSVYATLGVKGLYDIFYEKLGIYPDGYLKVGFDSFEEIIDLLGGAEVTLTKEEAEYLNTHNYISNENYRNVCPGTQTLNGNQTLGYCRVRFVPNINGTKHDYGRTERQRMVMENLFERYKEAGVMNWAKILKQALGYVETDISEKTLEALIFAIYNNRITELEKYQFPAKGLYETPKAVGAVTSPIVVDWEANRTKFQETME